MKTNRHLLKRLNSIQQTLVAQHASVESLGEARSGWQSKLFLAEFLTKVFPAPIRFSTGSIVDSAGRVASSVDIVVEQPMSLSFPMSGPSQDRLLMAESVAMVIEVRSDLSRQLADISTRVKSVKRLQRRLRPRVPGAIIPPPTIPVIGVGYTGFENSERLRGRRKAISSDYRPDALLVLDPGLFDGFGMAAQGAVSLYSLCIAISRMVHKLSAAEPNLVSYVFRNSDNWAEG